MGNFLYVGKRPLYIKYGNSQVKKLVFNGVVVWTAADQYAITCVITGQGYRTETEYNCDCVDNCNCLSFQCDCDCNCYSQCDVSNSYGYNATLTFNGVTQLPIKYIAKSGATVTIQASALQKSGSAYIYNGHATSISGATDYSRQTALDNLKDYIPQRGIDGYSDIVSLSFTDKNNGVATTKNTVDCTHNCGNCDNCDCDGNCDGGDDGGGDDGGC